MDLTTSYLGLALKNPIIASASPLSEKVENVQRLEQAGASAVVMYSLFEEQIINESLFLDKALDFGSESSPEALSYFPTSGRYSRGAEDYLDHLKALKHAVGIPVISSLNGTRSGQWVRYARMMQDAGADAIELNLYDLPVDLRSPSQDLEARYIQLVSDVCSTLTIPVALKLSPFFTSLPNMASRFVTAGAKGLVLFNRFYQPDVDLETLDVVPTLNLSDPQEMRLPLRWIAILHDRVAADFALTTGVQNGQHVIKAMMVGARVVMVASELLRRGPSRVQGILDEVVTWMHEKEYSSIKQMQGSMAAKSVADPSALERANYMKVLSAFRSR
jgi:dihydroorotate dehydrogenase (fumarate)